MQNYHRGAYELILWTNTSRSNIDVCIEYRINYPLLVKCICYKMDDFDFYKVVRIVSNCFFILTLFLLGGGQFDPPSCSFFLHNSKSIGLRLLKFSDLSYILKALPLGLKLGFNTNCLSPQAHCLNDCFCL